MRLLILVMYYESRKVIVDILNKEGNKDIKMIGSKQQQNIVRKNNDFNDCYNIMFSFKNHIFTKVI